MSLMKAAFPWHLVAPLYQERHRSYHGVRHVHSILRRIDNLEGMPVDERNWLSAVGWLHDACHDPLAKSPVNERRSADLLMLPEFGGVFSQRGWELAQQAIMASAYHTTDQQLNEPMVALFLDLDLAHFGDDEAAYVRTSRSVSEEYRRVGTTYQQLLEGHPKFATQMLARHKIFYTPYFADKEEQARANLTLSLNHPQLMIGSGKGEEEFVETTCEL